MSYPTFHTDDQGILVASQALNGARALLHRSGTSDDRGYALRFQFQSLETTLREITDARLARSLSVHQANVTVAGNENVNTLIFIVTTVHQMLMLANYDNLSDDDGLPGQSLLSDIPDHPSSSHSYRDTTVDHAITQLDVTKSSASSYGQHNQNFNESIAYVTKWNSTPSPSNLIEEYIPSRLKGKQRESAQDEITEDVVASVSKREKVSDEECENILFRQAIRSASTSPPSLSTSLIEGPRQCTLERAILPERPRPECFKSTSESAIGRPRPEFVESPSEYATGSPRPECFEFTSEYATGSPQPECFEFTSEYTIGRPRPEFVEFPSEYTIGHPRPEFVESPSEYAIGRPQPECSESPSEYAIGSPTSEYTIGRPRPEYFESTSEYTIERPRPECSDAILPERPQSQYSDDVPVPHPVPNSCFEECTSDNEGRTGYEYEASEAEKPLPSLPGSPADSLFELSKDFADHTFEESSRNSLLNESSSSSSLDHGFCVVCGDPCGILESMAASCGHRYCKSCVGDLVTAYINDESLHPLRCCKTEIPIFNIEILLRDTTGNLIRFREKHEEYSTPHDKRIYCPQRGCHQFIKPSKTPASAFRFGSWSNRTQDTALCVACYTSVCLLCKELAHPGEKCEENKNATRLRELVKEKGWQTCSKCHSIIEKISGCLHMTCRCGFEFCYRCGAGYTGPGMCGH